MAKKIELPIETIREMYESGSSAREIADAFGVHATTVERRLRANGVSLGRRLDLDVEEIVRLYEQGENTVTLAKKFGTDPSVIGGRLKEAGVKLRPGGKFKKGMAREKYTDEDWLRTQYWDKKRSQVEIAAECGVTPTLISQKMRKFGIPARSQTESKLLKYEKHVALDTGLLSILEGELLGDGSLLLAHSGHSAAYQHGTKHRDYLIWLRQLLQENGLECGEEIYVSESDTFGTGTIQTSYSFKSRYFAELVALRERFYVGTSKVVPDDLVLNKTSMLHWYLGDGYLDRRRPSITLCTDAFDASSTRHLRAQLAMLGIRTSLASSQGRKTRIYIGMKATPLFIDLIGPCPTEIEPIYGYKWAYANPR